MAVTHVLFVHGYSVRNLNTYAQFPALIRAAGYRESDIFLSAFQSLDDAVNCDDLARALEDSVAFLELTGKIELATTAVICHSTGTMIARRWILDRAGRGAQLPSHFVSIAGANHGSTLAQLGETAAAHVFREINGGTQVGAGVLTDLDYGSRFLLKLNGDWLEAANAGRLGRLFVFSMGGDDNSGWVGNIIWQVKEAGSDSTVRISGANLNYAVMEADADTGRITAQRLDKPVPHLVLHNYSHTGQLGIIDSVTSAADPPFAALMQALAASDDASYAAVLNDWTQRTAQWTSGNSPKANATLVFNLRDRTGRPIDDSLIVLRDPTTSDATALSGSLVNRPVRNKAFPSSVAFYLNVDTFHQAHAHAVHIEARSGSAEIDYEDVDYPVPGELGAFLAYNQTTYVHVTMNRDTDQTYAFYNFLAQYPPAPWPPFPVGHLTYVSRTTVQRALRRTDQQLYAELARALPAEGASEDDATRGQAIFAQRALALKSGVCAALDARRAAVDGDPDPSVAGTVVVAAALSGQGLALEAAVPFAALIAHRGFAVFCAP